MDRLTKFAHFIPVKFTNKTEDYAILYIDEIVRWHGIPLTIFLDRATQYTSHFLRSFQKNLGTQVNLYTTFHPQTDGKVEHTIQTLEDMLRACVIDLRGKWDDHLSLIEFSYNNNYHSSIGMTPFEALYCRRCGSFVGQFEVGELSILGPEIIHEALEKVRVIRDRLATTYSLQKSNADNRKWPLKFDVVTRFT